MSTDGGSLNITPSPDDSGGSPSQGGEPGGKTAAGQIPVELRVVAENLGIKLVPEKDWAERERVYGSVKHGSVAQKLAEYDKFVEADKKRKDGTDMQVLTLAEVTRLSIGGKVYRRAIIG